MKRNTLFFTLFLLLLPYAIKAQEAYAVYNAGTLTFYYDTSRNSRQGDSYDLNYYYYEPNWLEHKNDITKAVFKSSFAKARPTSNYSWFYGMKNLSKIEGIQYLNTSQVTYMDFMFYHCSGLTSLDLSHFDTSQVNSMHCMFDNCSGLTSLDVSHFNTSQVTNMTGIFVDCTGLTNLDVSHFDTSKVKYMSYMFTGCSGLTNLDVSHFDTSNVTSMYAMFSGCGSLTSLDVSHFDTSQVTEMSWMFTNCSGLTNLDVSHFDTSQVTDMRGMFESCSGLTSLDVSHFDTSMVTNMYTMFYGCGSLTNLDVSHYDTSQITNMSAMFYGCGKLTSLDVSHFNTSKVTDMGSMFSGCSSLTSIDVSHFDTSKIEDMDGMFNGCSGLSSLDVSHFDTSKVMNMTRMFDGCSGLTSLDASHFDTSKVKYMYQMFYGCSGLTALDLSRFDTSKVLETGYMFYNCTQLETIYCSDRWDTDQVDYSWDMFTGCSNLKGGMGTTYNNNHVDKEYARIDGGPSNPGYFTYKPYSENSYVDLGLPSGTLWAEQNFGATTSSDDGAYFAWGETAPKNTYTWANYQHADGTAATVKDIGSDISGTSNDVVFKTGGEDVFLPTKKQFDELLTNCTLKETTTNGVKGYKVTGPNGKSIFLPFSGCSYDGKDYGKGASAYYWTSDLDATNTQKANALFIKSGTSSKMTVAQRRTGTAIRPVKGVKEEEMELVDLGLSVKWANMNIDATATSGQGGYYAWGETKTKAKFSWATYTLCNGTAASCTNIGSNISKKKAYDRAYAYNTTMCLPTAEQWNELVTKCTWTAATVNGVKGYNVKGPSGKTIFLPFSGCSYDGKDYGSGSYGYYWSANNVSSDVSKAQAAYVKSGTKTTIANLNRRTGVAIRAVEASSEEPTPTETLELVDLGLSVKWANMNIDATATSGQGGYYAWGETKTKAKYSWATYTLCNGTAASCTNIGSNISKKKTYDRAYAYNTTMCLPTEAQWNELVTKCTWTAATVNGVKGYNVKGPSGKTIFLPFSGCSYDGKDYGSGAYGYYWSANNVSSDVSKAQAAYVKSGTKTTIANLNRRTGVAIRAVSVETSGGGDTPTPTETLELVDLGLSVKWANMNIDATATSGQGGYYAWGEPYTKSTYSWATYSLCNGTATSCTNIGNDISKKKTYDRAYAYSSTMCLPTAAQWNELVTKCTWTAATVNGVKGYNVKGPSGKTIFLPFSGCSYDGKDYGSGTYGYYWSANNVSSDVSKAQAAYVKSGTKTTIANLNRRTGVAIRAVSVETSSGDEEPTLTNTPELVDLGLSVKWANMNIDATKTSVMGGYYAWGESYTKSIYSWATYSLCNGTAASCTNIGSNISKKMGYDCAYTYSSTMCLPTAAQWNELITKCTWTAVTINNVKGYKVKGPCGKSIFLPFSGCSYDGKDYEVGTAAYYWTANNVSSSVSKAQAAYVKSGATTTVTNINRRTGVAIRPVSVATLSYAPATDDINYIKAQTPEDDAIYTLQGIKVEGALRPGIYIKNGQKFVVK